MQSGEVIDRISQNDIKVMIMNEKDIAITVKRLLIDILSLDVTEETLTEETLLLGNIPEFDSMAIVSVLTEIEERFNFTADDDDLSAEVFESVGSFIHFIRERV